jgi:dUTP pyrophosphatase
MLKVKKLDQYAILPVKQLDSAGYDLYSCEKVTIPPQERALAYTGIACEFPSNYVARICDRSGIAIEQGLHVIAGVIDSNYRGEWAVIFYNTTNKYVTLEAQTRIAQVLFYQVANFLVGEVCELSNTERGAGGFGSTGDK